MYHLIKWGTHCQVSVCWFSKQGLLFKKEKKRKKGSENTPKVKISNKHGLLPESLSVVLFTGVKELHFWRIPLERNLSGKQSSNSSIKGCVYSKGHFPAGMQGEVCGCRGERHHLGPGEWGMRESARTGDISTQAELVGYCSGSFLAWITDDLLTLSSSYSFQQGFWLHFSSCLHMNNCTASYDLERSFSKRAPWTPKETQGGTRMSIWNKS